jgi:hypothetical protein
VFHRKQHVAALSENRSVFHRKQHVAALSENRTVFHRKQHVAALSENRTVFHRKQHVAALSENRSVPRCLFSQFMSPVGTGRGQPAATPLSNTKTVRGS